MEVVCALRNQIEPAVKIACCLFRAPVLITLAHLCPAILTGSRNNLAQLKQSIVGLLSDKVGTTRRLWKINHVNNTTTHLCAFTHVCRHPILTSHFIFQLELAQINRFTTVYTEVNDKPIYVETVKGSGEVFTT